MNKYNLINILVLLFTVTGYAMSPICFEPYMGPKEKAHFYITRDIYNGDIVGGSPFSKNDNRNEIFKVLLKFEERDRTTILKPRYYGDGFGWNRVPMEYVAYELNLKLGMDYIPPVAYRRNIKVDNREFSEGAFLHYIDDPHQLKDVDISKWDLRQSGSEFNKDLFFSDVRILDTLLQNEDRHIDNYIRGKHWVDGTYRPMLIDHGASLRKLENTISMKTTDAFGNGSIKIIRQSTYEKLMKLDENYLSTLGEFITKEEIHFILSQKDLILKYFDELIRVNGFEKVVIP